MTQPIIPVANLENTHDSVTDDLKDFNTFTLSDEDLIPNVADAIAAALESPSDEEAWKSWPEDHEVLMTHPSVIVDNIDLDNHNKLMKILLSKIFL